jgi:putative hydrolase of the HAD superfamily
MCSNPPRWKAPEARPSDTLSRVSLNALVLDYGEVLVRAQRPESVQHMAALARLREEDLRQRYWRWRLDYDRGVLSDSSYWQRVVDGADIRAAELDDVVAALVAADYASWSDYREELWDTAAQFRRGGGRTAILSNGVPGVFAGVRRDRRLADYFDAVIVSCEVGCTKPDRRIYELCLSQLGEQPESTLFVDDRLENLEGAARVGMRTLHFAGDAGVDELRRMIGPFAR